MTENSAPEEDQIPTAARPRPVVLLLLDGWGIAPESEANAIAMAKTPNFSSLVKEYPVAALEARGHSFNSRYLSLGSGSLILEKDITPEITLRGILAAAEMKQLKIAESERLAAVSFFWNGRQEGLLANEREIVISSAGGNLSAKPDLALTKLSNQLVKAIKSEVYDFILAVFPNADLASLTGDFEVTKKAVEAVDRQLKKIVNAVLDADGVLVISAACGNAEYLKNMATELPDKEMTDNNVPLLIIGRQFRGQNIGLADALDNDLSLLAPSGNLADIAPTILKLMGLPKADKMGGESLI